MCKRLKIAPKPGHVLFIGTHNRICARRRALSFLAALILFEGVVPWLRGGCTFGGSFTHMTVETRPREDWRRAAFYVARMATLIIVLPWHSGGFNLLVFIGLGIFWLGKRQMPYDLI